MKIAIIAAVAQNNVIGNNNSLIWHLPADLRYFKQKTTGHHIIMGRNTFDSLGGRPLPNRTTVIITRNENYTAPEGCLVAHSLQEAIALCTNDDEIFICGGSQIYALAFDYATDMYLTRVHHSFEGDALFPDFDISQWELIKTEQQYADEKNHYDFSFNHFVKQN
ncbi:MAG: dihydrofolate reductase [Bacteroidales bacterium]|jgi:dihydrofolate reductase|nr:dihydrofolate reductase [Bacteroidales bacterium]